jgi:copper chaperone CopZ
MQFLPTFKIQKMKSSTLLIASTLLLSFMACSTQIKNAATKNIVISGNCAMCESSIEKAGNVKGVSQIEWNQDTKIATMTYDSAKTNQDEILKRIALAGYDSEQFLAPDDAYAKLPECCQYDRTYKQKHVQTETMEDHSMHKQEPTTNVKPSETSRETNQLTAVFDNYFAVKDALVNSDGNSASTKAKSLLQALNGVQMNKLSHEAHNVWMDVMKDLISDTKKMEATKNIELQRTHFMTLSDNLYKLLKVAKLDSTIYFQHCPMANDGKGANWLSKENVIKNPYYGSAMLSCGNTVETFE